MSERGAAFELVKQMTLYLAAEKEGRQAMEVTELAERHEFIAEQVHLFEEAEAAGKAYSIFEHLDSLINDILHNRGGRIR